MDYQKPLQVKAYESLKEMILSNHFVPGTIYSETKVSKELGISRTPLRDAIQRLAQEKYIDVIPSKGFRIHTLTDKDLTETYQIRAALEGFCIVQITQHAQDAEMKKVLLTLESLLRDQAAVAETADTDRLSEDELTDAIDAFAAYDQEFHERIIASAGNDTITALFQTYLHQIRTQTLLSLREEGRLSGTVKEHREIVEAIRSGSVERAYLAAVGHLKKAGNIIRKQGF